LRDPPPLKLSGALHRCPDRRSESQVAALPLRLRREIGHKLFLLEEDLSGNVKKLKGSRTQYRLRAGDYRILFELEGRILTVYAVGNRKDIYR